MTGERHGDRPQAGAMWTAIGLMSGTSMDGVDAAVIATDGEDRVVAGAALTVAYDAGFRARLRGCLGGRAPAAEIAAVAAALTDHHAAAVVALCRTAGLDPTTVDVVGFPGHTLVHDPARRLTWQIGDGDRLARATGLPVVTDFRSADVAAGGQGAPLVPVFHRALARASGMAPPLAVINIGGVANVTWIGPDGQLCAMDVGPGNALIDDWLVARTGEAFDRDGRRSARGRVDHAVLNRLMATPWFDLPGPKSLDRDAFDPRPVGSLGIDDGCATLAAFTAAAIARSAARLPVAPARWLVTGGGRHNRALMAMLADRLDGPVDPVEAVGWSGDAIEALAFGYLAVRSRRGLPLTVPETTGVDRPRTGGRWVAPPAATVRPSASPAG